MTRVYVVSVRLDNGQRRSVNVAAPSRAEAEQRAAGLTFGKHRVVVVEGVEGW